MMNWNVVAGIALGVFSIPFVMFLFWGMNKAGWRKAGRHAIWYSLDVIAALVGFTLGFGLQVQSWAWLLGSMFLLRFTFYVMREVAAKEDKL